MNLALHQFYYLVAPPSSTASPSRFTNSSNVYYNSLVLPSRGGCLRVVCFRVSADGGPRTLSLKLLSLRTAMHYLFPVSIPCAILMY